MPRRKIESLPLTEEQRKWCERVDISKESVADLVSQLETAEGLNQYWIDAGRHALQVGFMLLKRGIAQPKGF